MAEIVSTTYALSLFSVAKEHSLTDEILQEITVLATLFEDNKAYIKLLDSPELSTAKKHSLIEESVGNSIHKYTLNFLKILCDKKRFSEFFKIQEEYRRLYNKENNIIEVEAVTAITMSDTLLEKLTQKLCNVTKQKVIVKNTVDTSIYGGVILNYGNYQIDSSVKHQLDGIKTALKELTI